MYLFAIPFPMIDPVMLRLGPLAIHWYGMAYIAGILFGWWYARKLVANRDLWRAESPLKPSDIDDFLTWAVIGIIVGGRLGYVLFYDLPAFIDNPLRIAMIWTGGMSFHGGLLGTIIAMILFARSRGFSVFPLFDVIAASVGIGIFLGRLANFINQELWGKPTALPWGVIFPAAGPQPRHPTQLYEAVLEGLVLFTVLRVLTHCFNKLEQPGFVAGAFITWYAIARIIAEFFRLPDIQIGYLYGGWLTMGMVLSLPLLVAGIWLMASAPLREQARRGKQPL
jgi:phosphatidylglycerol---prolipoprotein diacylglyceryl transferase